MAGRSTRNKIRFQGSEAESDLVTALDYLNKAQKHLVQMGALADDQSRYINDTLPVFVATLEEMIKGVRRLREGL